MSLRGARLEDCSPVAISPSELGGNRPDIGYFTVNAPTMLAGIELADPDLSARVASGLTRVEDLLERELISEFSFVTEAASHLMHAGGKRFRPLFTLVAAGIGPSRTPRR